MKYLQRLLAFVTLCAAFFSCQKEYSIEHPVGGSNVSAQWEFKEAGVLFKGSIDTVEVATINNYKFITIDGRSSDGTAEITLQVFGADIKVGTYKTPFSLFAYVKGGNYIYQTDQTLADSFTVVITKIDSFSIAGTFSGKASKTIVDGKFSAVIKQRPVTPPASTDSGQVVLWSKAGCGGGTSTTPINVSVNNNPGQITKFYLTEPVTCDPTGTFSVKLPVGTYPWVAKCGTDSITGMLTVTKNGCTKQLVDFTAVTPLDYFPITTNSNWSYLYAASTPDDTLYVLSTGKKDATGAYNLFTNKYGPTYKDSSYYKKGNGIYSEYLPADSTGTSFIDHIFLKDNVTPGTPWKTATPGGVLQGLTYTGEIRDTLIQKLASVTVAGNTYTDVLEVHTGFFLVFTAGAQQAYLVKQWFAKGKGLIKYYQNDYVFGNGESTMNLTKLNIAP